LLGFRDLYVADLDAISGKRADQPLYRALLELRLDLWVDAGLKTPHDLEALGELKRATIVVGLETASGPDFVQAILDRAGPDRVVLSLDLFDRTPRLEPSARWRSPDPYELAGQVLDLGVRHLLLLDLARVGTSRGTGTDELLTRLVQERPGARFSVGGGISGIDEIVGLRRAGAAAVLVGSALHDGRIGREELAQLADDP
jgi:phosphoribosylformimino-5-aminoimidazole carboxamide ribotide isomerase